MSAATLVWLAIIATGSQAFACDPVDQLHKRRQRWAQRESLRFELTQEVQRRRRQRLDQEAATTAKATVEALRNLSEEMKS